MFVTSREEKKTCLSFHGLFVFCFFGGRSIGFGTLEQQILKSKYRYHIGFENVVSLHPWLEMFLLEMLNHLD